jgi:predicted AlkP superfamily phosphohydrolase/phosphomutase/Tfp pilus assembly protein PilF
MFRTRAARALLLIAGIGALLYAITGLFLPSSRKLTFGVDKHNGNIRMVRSMVTFLPPHQFYTLSFDKRDDAAQKDGLVRILSKEGVPVTISYRLKFGVASTRLPDAQRLVRSGWNAWLGARVGEAVSAVTRQVPIEELLSPTSQFAARRDVLRRTVADHLGRSGLKVTDFAIARMEPDRDELLRYKRGELRRQARGVAGRVAIIALDGADWELLSELSNDGRIPNLRALILGGTTGSVQTIQPTVSPLLWTTAATGLAPDRHGVIDFVDRGTNGPVTAYSRRAPAIWEVAEAFGRPSAVINWWTAWPPQRTSTAVYGVPSEVVPGAVYPPELAPRINTVAVPENTIGYAQVGRFLNITANEYEQAVKGDPSDPVRMFRGILARTWTDHRAGLEIYSQRKPLLTMISYEGTDEVNHLFGAYHPPYREGVSQENYRRYWPAVANYYAEIDRLIGEWMNVLSDDTTVMIVSAHGYRWGKTRPYGPPAGRTALADHRNPGVFIAYGNHVAASRAAHAMSIYDLTPTALAILGLPASSEMPGHVAEWAFNDIHPVSSVRVISYSEFFNARPMASDAALDPKAYRATLQAIGHVGDPTRGLTPVFEDGEQMSEAARVVAPQQWASYAWYNNQAILLRSQGKLKESSDLFEKAIELNPNHPTAYLNFAMLLFDRQQYVAADEVFVKAIEKGLPNGDRWFLDFAALYRERNMSSRAIALLSRARAIYPQSFAIAANLGSALAAANRYTEAQPELERALGMQPSSTLALNNLGALFAKRNDLPRALDFWNRSLTIDARQPEIRAAATAAQGSL